MKPEKTAEEPKQNAQTRAPVLDQRAAYTLGEFASLFGKHKNWGYRMAWLGKVKVIRPLGEMLVPRSEVERLTSAPVDYDTVNA